MEYFAVFFLLMFNGEEFRSIFLKMEDNRTFGSLHECVEFADKQADLIVETLNEQGILYKDLMFKCVEERKQQV